MDRFRQHKERTSLFALVISFAGIMACTQRQSTSQLTTSQSTVVVNGVRTFVAQIASDISQRGPAAWQSQFAETPNFFMAAEGRLIFANRDEASRGIPKLSENIARIELRWGEPIRVDPLTPELATVGMPYHELRVDKAGHRVEESGFFTGLAELGSKGWRLRNAHWSVSTSPSVVP